MTAQLDGSTALVTGGTSGIGRAIALDLAAHGAHVIVSGRDTARAEDVVAAIRANGGKADFVTTALSDETTARNLARRATEAHHPAVLQASAARAGTLHELTKLGQVELEVPRNRDGSFAPVIVKMRQRRLGEVDEIVLYARA